MPTELEELVGFLHSPQFTIREIAIDHLVGYSSGDNAKIFKIEDYRAIKDLKILAREKSRTIASQALTILVNLCDDREALERISTDDKFLEFLVTSICNIEEKNTDLMCILLANCAKNDNIIKVFNFKKQLNNDIFKSEVLLDSLMDCFVKGSDRSLNKFANYDYLSYFFADLSKHLKGRKYFITKQNYDNIVPITKLLVFTEKYDNKVRREGICSTIKNSLFSIDSHEFLLNDSEINLLPYLLLPLAGPDGLDEEEMFALPDELQLLPDDKKREPLPTIITTHLESLLLLCSTRKSRDYMREKSVYPIIRELHKVVSDEEVQDRCEKLVDFLMRDESSEKQKIEEIEEVDEEDYEITEIV